jgi:Toprim-like/DNA primase catalytic core, N-terminal domain
MAIMEWVDFRLLKQTVTIAEVLEHYGIVLKLSGGGTLRGACPLPTHSSDLSEASFIADGRKNVWACHSQSCVAARRGAIGGNILDFVCVMEACSLRTAGLLIQRWSHPVHPKRPMHAPTPNPVGRANPELTFRLTSIQSKHPYLQQRGVDAALADRFGIGFYPGRGIMCGRIVIPVHNERGRLVAYAGRAVDRTNPRYRFPAGFRKSAELYNVHRCHLRSVVLVEGFFDVLNVVKAGFDAVALMGASLSERQRVLLLSHFSEVVLLLDGDDAGRQATRRIAEALKHLVKLRVGVVPDGHQPDSLRADEIRQLVTEAF